MSENETVSVSKGVFVFKNNSKKSRNKTSNFSNTLWYKEYMALWSRFSNEYEVLTTRMFSSMLCDLVDFVKNSHNNSVSNIPTAVLLTGINMPDHHAQFKSLEKKIEKDITPHVAFLNAQDCSNIKCLMENMINQFVNENYSNNYSFEEDNSCDHQAYIKKSHLSMSLLQSWYEDKYPIGSSDRKLLVVVMPDFESYITKVLQTFILIISSYIDKVPFVVVFGVATSINAVHTSLPYHVTSKIHTKVFLCEPSTVHLNKTLEDIFLNPFCQFQMGGNVFDLFIEIFLYYDFSVKNFVQNIKYAMMEHFCYGNAMALCQFEKHGVTNILSMFDHQDCENVRHLLSFRKLVETEPPKNKIKLLTNDEYLQKVIYTKVDQIQKYIRRLHIFLECLHYLVSDLPGCPLGKNYREIYAIAARKTITESTEYKEAMQLLQFQSKDELTSKLDKIIKKLHVYINTNAKKTQMKEFQSAVEKYKDMLDNFDDLSDNFEEAQVEANVEELNQKMNRRELKETLLSKVKEKSRPLSKYEKLRKEIIEYLSQNFKIHLVHYTNYTFHEIFFFDDISIKMKILGMHRAAIHTALNNPQQYLQCKCCDISKIRTIKSTMPDICIAYKLHLEYGKLINLYDWLQAFLFIVDPKESDDFDDKSKKIVDPRLQARFTQAVAELEYLGFIKSAKRKTDHVTRLTWEG